MNIVRVSGCLILGMTPLLWLPVLPAPRLMPWCVAGALLLLAIPDRKCRYAGITVLAFCWGALSAHQVVWPVQHLSKKESVEALIMQTDGDTRHRIHIIRRHGRWVFPAIAVELIGSAFPLPVCIGQRWQLALTLRPVHGQLNDGGFDRQRYMLAQGIVLQGRIANARLIHGECGWRARYICPVVKKEIQPQLSESGQRHASALTAHDSYAWAAWIKPFQSLPALLTKPDQLLPAVCTKPFQLVALSVTNVSQFTCPVTNLPKPRAPLATKPAKAAPAVATKEAKPAPELKTKLENPVAAPIRLKPPDILFISFISNTFILLFPR